VRAFFSTLILVIAIGGTTPNRGAAADDIIVLAAASLATALDEIVEYINSQTGMETNILVSYGGTGGLSRQIENGLPGHIFISASRPWIARLVSKGLLDATSVRDILTNRLALVANNGFASDLKIYPGFPIAEALGNGRLAIGETTSVPAGIYAKQALQSLGVWESVKDKLAPAKDVRAALMLVQRQETELGIVYKTDAAVGTNIYVVDTFDPTLHEPIYYTAAMLTHADAAIAQPFYDHLTGQVALGIFKRHGFRGQ
jgi:molybdate transport system substrate-binding protein